MFDVVPIRRQVIKLNISDTFLQNSEINHLPLSLGHLAFNTFKLLSLSWSTYCLVFDVVPIRRRVMSVYCHEAVAVGSVVDCLPLVQFHL